MDLSRAQVAVVAADETTRRRAQSLLESQGHTVTLSEPRLEGPLAGHEVLVWAPWAPDGPGEPDLAWLDRPDLRQVGVVVLCPGAVQQQAAVRAGADATLQDLDDEALRLALSQVRKLVELRRTGPGSAPGRILDSPALRLALDEEFQRMERYQGVLSLLEVHVRPVTAEQHAGLDQDIGAALERGLRDVDRLACVDRHRFAVLLPLTDAAAARLTAERVRKLVAAMMLRPAAPPGEPAGRRLIKCTASVGVATFPSPGVRGKNQLLERAGQAAAQAADGGGNRVVYHDGEFLAVARPAAEEA
jgi:hypothetical protein